jgi:hypothetical protein
MLLCLLLSIGRGGADVAGGGGDQQRCSVRSPFGGRVSSEALMPDGRRGSFKRYAHGRVGLDAAAYSGHSLRSGFLTSAAESGASIFKMVATRDRHLLADSLLISPRSPDQDPQAVGGPR